MTIIAETDRLVIRTWIPQDDAEQALKIYSDPEVTRFFSSTKASDVEQMVNILERWLKRATQLNNGTGLWAMVLKETGEIVGTILLILLKGNDGQFTEDYEIGWHLKKSAWGKGYATEAAIAIINYGFNILNLREIYSIANQDNIASIRVTQRLGMVPLGSTNKYHNKKLELFKLSAPTQ
ncbi:GCN5-related N-acetyltransferase [Calothrix sp. NIES-4071]|nr:GCN5-related N-acetyltransferase [Calothrix sp. NIES-4071]BAZ58770.1 GCN5-related N-acetyltransferase [Calothrix sp. NIES-4105]